MKIITSLILLFFVLTSYSQKGKETDALIQAFIYSHGGSDSSGVVVCERLRAFDISYFKENCFPADYSIYKYVSTSDSIKKISFKLISEAELNHFHPGNKFIYVFSKPFFSKNYKRALIYYSKSSPYDRDWGTYSFKHKNGKWIEEEFLGGGSDEISPP